MTRVGRTTTIYNCPTFTDGTVCETPRRDTRLARICEETGAIDRPSGTMARPGIVCHLSEQSYRNCRLLFVPTRQGNTVAVRTHIHPCGGGETRWPAALPSERGPEPSSTIHRIQLFLVDGCRLFAIKGGPPVVGGPAREDQEPRPFLVSAPQQHTVCPAGL